MALARSTSTPETPTYTGLPAGSLFERAARGLSHGAVSPRDARPGDIVGVRMILRRDGEGEYHPYVPRAFLLMEANGLVSSRAFADLPPERRTDGALISTWLTSDEICEGLDLDWDMKVFARACGELPVQTYDLALMPGLALLVKDDADTTRFDNIVNRGQTQRACDEVRRILLPEPTSAHDTLEIARLFDDAGYAAYQAVVDTIAEEERAPHRVRPIALPNVKAHLASLRAGR